MKNETNWYVRYRKMMGFVFVAFSNSGSWKAAANKRVYLDEKLPEGFRPDAQVQLIANGAGGDLGNDSCNISTEGVISVYFTKDATFFNCYTVFPAAK